MTVDILIKNASLYHPERRELVHGSIAIKHGQIIAMGPSIGEQADAIIDGTGKVVMPGFIDLHVHFRDLEQGYKETFSSGTKAAVHGGVTTALCMPNTKPPVVSDAVLAEYMQRASGNAYCNVGFIAGYPGDAGELDRLVDRGVHGIKIYMERSLGDHDWNDDIQLKDALHQCFKRGLRVHVHPGVMHDKEEDAAMFDRLTTDGGSPLEAFSAIHSEDMETRGLQRVFRLARKVLDQHDGLVPGIHACHVSCKAAFDEIAAWQSRLNGAITCEVAPHHLFLSNAMPYSRVQVAKVLQPLRGEQDVKAMMELLRAGRIDVIASDHAPHAVQEKTAPFMEAAPGFPVLDIYAPVICTACINHGMAFTDIARACCEAPARLARLDHRKGKIKPRFDADLVVLEQTEPRPVDVDAFHSQSKVSPYQEAGTMLEWAVTHVIVDGDLQVEDGFLTGKPGERLLRRRKILLE